MKVKMQTLSGAVYVIDFDALTWERVGRRPIWGMNRESGRLSVKPTLRIGGSAFLDDTVAGTIRTTPVQRLEVIG